MLQRTALVRLTLALFFVSVSGRLSAQSVVLGLDAAPAPGGPTLRASGPLIQRLLPADGNAAGVGAISGVETTQVLYDLPEIGSPTEFGNTVMVTWTSGEAASFSVRGTTPGVQQVFVAGGGDGFAFLAGFPRCQPETEDCPSSTPGDFEVCPNVEQENLFEITVVGVDDSTETVCQEVLPSWPLANDMELTCTRGSGPALKCPLNPDLSCSEETEGIAGRCGIIVGGCNNGPTASGIDIFVDGVVRLALSPEPSGEPDEIFCFRRWLEVPATSSHQVTALGFLSRDKAADTVWTDDSGIFYEAPTGAFFGIDPSVLLPQFEPTLRCDVTDGCFSRGRVDESSPSVDLSDGVAVLNFLFLGGVEPPCLAAADIDDTGDVSLTDAVVLFSFLFIGGSPPPPPFGACGDDAAPDTLGCDVPACS